MSKTLLLFLLFIFQSLSTQKERAALKIAEATSREWFSGAPGGRTGIEYSIKIYINTNKQIEFTNMWLGKENVPFRKALFSEKSNEMKKGDSLLLTYNHINGFVDTSAISKRVPLDYRGEALIECVVNNEAKYFVVKSFKKLEPLKGM